MSYLEDFRKQVLSQIDMGHTIEYVSQLYSIGTTSIKRWKRSLKETGSVMGRGRPYKIDDEELKLYMQSYPDASLKEIAAQFVVTSPGVFAALKRLNITRKKSIRYKERDESKKSY
ncbi:TPA: transposase [Legionella pneumophila]|uniref:IS630 transposase-related protein n=1 Tax=Legionella pneumophila TaxID=446 RepID=UPI00067D33C0|nr:IS630 transposase-related protein [Legionella pneumophila]HAT2150920.1 transposase [Legionella pneumophila]